MRAVHHRKRDGPVERLALLETFEEPLGDHHRLAAVRAQLLEMTGDKVRALAAYERAARFTTSSPERRYLDARATAPQRLESEEETTRPLG